MMSPMGGLNRQMLGERQVNERLHLLAVNQIITGEWTGFSEIWR